MSDILDTFKTEDDFSTLTLISNRIGRIEAVLEPYKFDFLTTVNGLELSWELMPKENRYRLCCKLDTIKPLIECKSIFRLKIGLHGLDVFLREFRKKVDKDINTESSYTRLINFVKSISEEHSVCGDDVIYSAKKLLSEIGEG